MNMLQDSSLSVKGFEVLKQSSVFFFKKLCFWNFLILEDL